MNKRTSSLTPSERGGQGRHAHTEAAKQQHALVRPSMAHSAARQPQRAAERQIHLAGGGLRPRIRLACPRPATGGFGDRLRSACAISS